MKIRKTVAITYYSIFAFFIVALLLVQFLTPIDPAQLVFNSAGSLQRGISNYMNIPATFNPTTGLDVVGTTPAPAIFCTLTNNVHLIGTDGSDYALNSATSYFQPYFDSVVNPYNNAPIDHIDVKVYLYCKPSTLSQYNYYPYLTSGTLNVQFNARDVNGVSHQAWGYNQNVTPGEPNGSSMLVAEFNEPVSAINAVVNTAGTNYVSQQSVITTGNLIFKQKLSDTISATYTLSGLDTYYGFQINSPSGSQQPTQQYVNMITPSQSQSFTIDKSKSSTITIQVGVNAYSTNENSPIVSIYPTIGGVVQSNNPIKDYDLPASPNAGMNGGYSVWNYAIDISNLPAGTYQVGLHGQTLPASSIFTSGQSRPWENVMFQIINTATSNNGLPCTASQLAANPPYQNLNGVCVAPTTTPNPTPPLEPPPAPAPGQMPCNLPNTIVNGVCTPITIPNLPGFDPTSIITWLSNTTNLIEVIAIIIFVGVVYHFLDKKRGGQGLQPQVFVE